MPVTYEHKRCGFCLGARCVHCNQRGSIRKLLTRREEPQVEALRRWLRSDSASINRSVPMLAGGPRHD